MAFIDRFASGIRDEKRFMNKIVFVLFFQIILTAGTETVHDFHAVKRRGIVDQRSDQTFRPCRDPSYQNAFAVFYQHNCFAGGTQFLFIFFFPFFHTKSSVENPDTDLFLP